MDVEQFPGFNNGAREVAVLDARLYRPRRVVVAEDYGACEVGDCIVEQHSLIHEGVCHPSHAHTVQVYHFEASRQCDYPKFLHIVIPHYMSHEREHLFARVHLLRLARIVEFFAENASDVGGGKDCHSLCLAHTAVGLHQFGNRLAYEHIEAVVIVGEDALRQREHRFAHSAAANDDG